jgi:hypothetical protein
LFASGFVVTNKLSTDYKAQVTAKTKRKKKKKKKEKKKKRIVFYLQLVMVYA